MTFVRELSGLIARHESQPPFSAQFPFMLADWVAPQDVTLSLSLGALRMQFALGNRQRAVRRQGLTPRATALLQVLLKPATLFQNVGSELRGITETSGFNAILHQFPVGTGIAGLRELIGGVDVGASLDARNYGTVQHAISLYTAGREARAIHWTSGATYSLALSREVAGDPALRLESFGSGADVTCLQFLYCADRYVTVRALASGQIVKVKRADGLVVAQAAEVGRVATVDLWGVLLDPVLHPLATVEVYASDGLTLVDTITPAGGVWPGDVYAPPPWTACGDPPATAWAECGARPATAWAQGGPAPATAWEAD